MHLIAPLSLVVCLSTLLLCAATPGLDASHPGARVVMDAHNCYPYFEWWADRIDRALSSGGPLAIEQDLYWYTNPTTGQTRSVLAHGSPASGNEPACVNIFLSACARSFKKPFATAIKAIGR